MKRFAVVFAFLLICAAAAYSQNTGEVFDYGTPVTIGSTYETSLDLSYRNDPNIRGRFVDRVFPSDAVWSPDGKQFFFTDSNNIYSVPVTGGTPRLLFESFYRYPYNGKTYLLNEGILSMVGFSSDGKKLYFISNQIDEKSEVSITEFEDGGYSVGIIGHSSPLFRSLDLGTGEITIITESGLYGALSFSGKYFENYISSAARIFDLESGEGWEIPDSGTCGYAFTNCFTADEQNIIYAFPDGNYMKFYTRPVRDGSPKEMTNISPITGEVKFVKMAPDGASIIYTVTTDTDEGLRLSSLTTGKTVNVVPFATISTRHPCFSPDGKQICYIRSSDTGYQLYTKDMTQAAAELGQITSVADAAPTGFALTGNYPNPFNPSTTISFTLSSFGAANLSIYSVTGQKVRELVSGPMSAGAHSVTWDGRDDSGKAVSSGVFLSRLSQGIHTVAGRMLLMK